MTKEFELLAPAGSLEILKAVINAGADAVYLGGDLFGARAYANNFTKEELIEGLHYAHLHDAKVYLTVNTLLKNQEMDKLYDYLLPFYQEGLDAVLVQDFGALTYIHERFPELDIHTSTQMTITGSGAVGLLKKYGVKRVVMAREMSVSEMEQIHQQTGMELEAFIHGALCYSYSGQCLFSSLLGGRSGNRGRCAQPCRLPYQVYDSKNKKIADESYVLSLKDFCGISALSKLRNAGVYSLKIEGRMKKISYATGVVSSYRKMIDRMLANEKNLQIEEIKTQLRSYGNRCGFTDTYLYKHNGKEMVTFEKPSFYQENDSYVPMEKKLLISGKLKLKLNQPATLTVFCNDTCVTIEKDIVERAQKQALVAEEVKKRLCKTGNTNFCFTELQLEVEEGIFCPNGALNQLRREAIESLENKLLSNHQREIPVFEEAHVWNQINVTEESNERFIVSLENRLHLSVVLSKSYVTDVYFDSSCYTRNNLLLALKEDVQQCKKTQKSVFYILPAIFRMETAAFYRSIVEDLKRMGLDGFVVKTYEELAFVKTYFEDLKIITDHNLYTYNNYANRAFLNEKAYRTTIPLELNRNEIAARDNHFSEMILYGYYPLMITAGCVNKNTMRCDHTAKTLFLKDRKNVMFPVKNICNDCYNIIYNSLPTMLFHAQKELEQKNVKDFRIHFSIEDTDMVQSILQMYEKHSTDTSQKFTNGHYKRGVE